MLLRTEGFDLTGLEALSDGCPMYISNNWHFGESLGNMYMIWLVLCH